MEGRGEAGVGVDRTEDERRLCSNAGCRLASRDGCLRLCERSIVSGGARDGIERLQESADLEVSR